MDNKKIEILLVDHKDNKTKFVLQEDAKKGDYFYIEEIIGNLEKISEKYFFDILGKSKENFEKSVKKQLEQECKTNVINAYKQSDEFLNIQKNNSDLQAKLNQINEKHKLDLDNKIQNSIKELEVKIINLENDNKNLKTNKDLDIQIKVTQEIKKEREKWEIIAKEMVETARKNANETIQKEMDKKSEENEKLKSNINQLTEKRNSISVGKDLEEWVRDQYDKFFSFQHGVLNFDLISQKSVTDLDNKNKGRVDFIFNCYDANNNLLSAVIECKSETESGEKKTKNEDHYKQVLKYARQSKSQYAILLTELEKNNRDFTCFEENKYCKEYPEIKLFVMRPAYIIIFLNFLIKLAEMKKLYIKENLNNATSEVFIKKFEKFKNIFINLFLPESKKAFESIEENSKKIIRNANSIIGFAEVIKTTNINKLNRKIRELETTILDVDQNMLINIDHDKIYDIQQETLNENLNNGE